MVCTQIDVGAAYLHFIGGSIERWEDPIFKKCFDSILAGDWPKYDPFDFTYRLEGNTDMYNRPNQVGHLLHQHGFHLTSALKVFCISYLAGMACYVVCPKPILVYVIAHRQGAYSSTAPGEGTIRFFPDLTLLTAYIMLRPFFKAVDNNPHKCVALFWAI